MEEGEQIVRPELTRTQAMFLMKYIDEEMSARGREARHQIDDMVARFADSLEPKEESAAEPKSK